MKFCVNITTGPLAGTLEDDDLRGEGRWERQIARGLLVVGEQVGTPRDLWVGDSPNWLGQVDAAGGVYVTIYGGPDQPQAAIYVFQFFSGPNAPIEAELRTLAARVGRKNLFLTYSYPAAGVYASLAPDLRDRVAWLPPPLPAPVDGDATERTVLFHPARGIAEPHAASMAADGGEEVRWVRKALLRHPALTFEVVAGVGADGPALVWGHPLFAQTFGDLRDRVTVHGPISHVEVQAIYARTRLVTCAAWYGGPPLESARHGIPVIACERDCALYSAPYTRGFPELSRLGEGRSLSNILDQLLSDPNYARRVGDAGRRYVAEHYGFAAFKRAMDAILARAGRCGT